MTCIHETWSWNSHTLLQFIQEGNYTEWQAFFQKNINLFETISKHLQNSKRCIYPDLNHVFYAFLPPSKIKVVLLGQDPYHNGAATGLCFSVKHGFSLNPSLKNIYQELHNEGFSPSITGDLSHWKTQGIFMLNTALTVEKGRPDTHTHLWQPFTNNLIEFIASLHQPIVWLLLGNKAIAFENKIPKHHKVVKASHPSPFSAYRGNKEIPAFLGSNIFILVNNLLETPIVW